MAGLDHVLVVYKFTVVVYNTTDLKWTTCATVNLVVNHVLKTLVVSRTQEDLGVHLATCVAVVHHLKHWRSV